MGELMYVVRASTGEIMEEYEEEIFSGIGGSETYAKKGQLMKNKCEDKFVWLYCTPQQSLFRDVPSHLITRLTMIGMYCEYNTNKVRRGKNYLTKHSFRAILGLQGQQIDKFCDTLEQKDYISFLDDGTAVLNKDVFGRGRMEGDDSVRIFRKYYIDLYNQLDVKAHYALGYILRLAPYLDKNTNMIVGADGNAMTFTQVAEVVGYSKSHGKELIEIMTGVKDQYGDDIVHLTKQEEVIVNPNLMFGGTVFEYIG